MNTQITVSKLLAKQLTGNLPNPAKAKEDFNLIYGLVYHLGLETAISVFHNTTEFNESCLLALAAIGAVMADANNRDEALPIEVAQAWRLALALLDITDEQEQEQEQGLIRSIAG